MGGGGGGGGGAVVSAMLWILLSDFISVVDLT